MPPVFRSFYDSLKQAPLLVKIPVEADRRDLRPGQILYQTVLALTSETLTLLNYDGLKPERHDLPLTDIQALRSYHVLLRGQFSLFLRDGSIITLGYNTVSRALVEKIIDQILQDLPGDSAQPTPPNLEPTISDYHYQTLLKEHKKRRPQVSAVYFEAPGTRGFTPQGKRRRSLGLLVLDSGKELLVLDRGSVQSQSLEALYGGDCTFFPRRHINDLEILTHLKKGKSQGEDLIVHLTGHSLGFRIMGSSEPLKILKSQWD